MPKPCSKAEQVCAVLADTSPPAPLAMLIPRLCSAHAPTDVSAWAPALDAAPSQVGKEKGGLEAAGEIPVQAQTGNTSTNTAPTASSCSDPPRAPRIQVSLDPVECGCDPGVSPHGTRQLKYRNSSASIENLLRPSWFRTVFPPNCKTKEIFWWFHSEVSQFAPVTQIHRDHGILSMAWQILVIFPIFISSQTHLRSNYWQKM